MRKKLIIDGSNLLYRTYWVAKNLEGKRESKPQAHIYFFLNTLRSYVSLFGPSNIVVCWDYRDNDQQNARKEELGEYKGQREFNPEIFAFNEELKEILDSLGVRQMYPKTLEADDIMYWFCAEKWPNECILVSSDTDMYQLVNPELNENIIYNPGKKLQINNVYLKQHYEVDNGRQFIIRKALKGDKSDNITGIRGIRKNRIALVIEAVGDKMDIEKAKEVLNEDEYKIFERNYRLMYLGLISENIDEKSWYEQLLEQPIEASKDRFEAVVKKLEFWNILKKLNVWFNKFQYIEETKINENYFNFFDE